MKCICGKVILLIAISAGFGSEAVAGALFRYDSALPANPDYVSPVSSAGNVKRALSPDGDIISVDRGKGFLPFNFTSFDGKTQFIESESAISTVGAGSDDVSFSAEVIFRAKSTSGTATLIGNEGDHSGFTLQIVDGKLCSKIHLWNNETAKIASVTLRTEVSSGEWHHAVFQVEKAAGQRENMLELYMDGVRQTAPPGFLRTGGMVQSTGHVILGASQLPDGKVSEHFFHGDIESASIRSGKLPKAYLECKAPRDGSPKLGLPSFLDFTGAHPDGIDKLTETLEKSREFQKHVVGQMPTPFINDGYVPQGLGTDGTDNFYLSLYSKTPAGKTDQHPSIIAQVGFDGQTRRVFQLLDPEGRDFTAHVGGCTWFGGYLYVAANPAVYRYDLDHGPHPDYVIDGKTYGNIRGDQNRIRPDKVYDPDKKGNYQVSFIEAGPGPNNKPYIWLGQWSPDTDRRLLGYPLDAAGDMATEPDFNFKLFARGVQGAVPYRVTGDEISFYLSLGDRIIAGDYPLRAKAEKLLRPRRLVVRTPAGNEDLALVNGKIWTINESGCTAHQLNSRPVPEYFPFVFGVKSEAAK